MWDELFSFFAGLMPLPSIMTQVIFAVIVGFGIGGLTAVIGLVALAPFAAVFAFLTYALIAVLAALRHHP